MSGPIPTMPLDKLKIALGVALDDERVRHDPKMLLICLSMAEYLKDAERWHHVAEHTVQWNNFEPRTTADFRKWIDQEIENERERLVHARERRQDGVPGDSGTGGTSDPVV